MFAELWKTAMQARLRYCTRDVVCLDPHSGYFYPVSYRNEIVHAFISDVEVTHCVAWLGDRDGYRRLV